MKPAQATTFPARYNLCSRRPRTPLIPSCHALPVAVAAAVAVFLAMLYMPPLPQRPPLLRPEKWMRPAGVESSGAAARKTKQRRQFPRSRKGRKDIEGEIATDRPSCVFMTDQDRSRPVRSPARHFVTTSASTPPNVEKDSRCRILHPMRPTTISQSHSFSR